jgi:hypothetical protein
LKVILVKPTVSVFIVILSVPKIIFAYVGPGTGLSAIGALLACLAGIVVAILGFFWYPIKRLLGKKSEEPDQITGEEQ